MRKKILRTLILVMFCMFACGVTVSAASAVATIGSKNYSSIDKALKAVKNGQTIKLKKNLTVKKAIEVKRNVKFTLDLGKHKVKMKNPKYVDETDGKKVTGVIRIRKGNVTLKNGKVTNAAIKVEQGAKLTINGGTYWQIVNLGTTTVKKGTIDNPKYSAITNHGKGKVTILGGTLRARGNGIWQPEGGTIVIKGGSFKTYNDNVEKPLVWVGKAKITISGGTFDAGKANALNIRNGAATITGGKFISGMIYSEAASVAIKDGSFSGSGNRLVVKDGAASITGGTFTGADGLPVIALTGNGKMEIKGGNISSTNGEAVHQENGTLNVEGGTFSRTRGDNPLIFVQGGKITIKNGDFNTGGQALYALYMSDGTAVVSGGTYKGGGTAVAFVRNGKMTFTTAGVRQSNFNGWVLNDSTNSTLDGEHLLQGMMY